MVDMRRGCADDPELLSYKARTVNGKVKRGWVLNQGRSISSKMPTVESGHTFNQSVAARKASTAFLVALRTLSTSNQHRNLLFRNRDRADVISGGLAEAVCPPIRCVCHDLHAYRNAGSIYRSVLSFKSSTSEFATPSGSLHMFFCSVRSMRLRQAIKTCKW
jgi:hypothetical protein